MEIGSIVDIVWCRDNKTFNKPTSRGCSLVAIVPELVYPSKVDLINYGHAGLSENKVRFDRYIFVNEVGVITILPEGLLYICELTKQPYTQHENIGKYEKIGQQLGAKTDEKSLAYGKEALQKSGDLLRHFMKNYKQPDGLYLIPDALIGHICIQVRIMDKQSRIFNNPAGDLLGENPYEDIAGYAIQMSDKGEEKNE